jgi:chromosome segregation ATPase
MSCSGSEPDRASYEPEHAVARFTALRADEYREWSRGASDAEIAQLTSGLRKLRDAWMEADARCINLEVDLNMSRRETQDLAVALDAAEAKQEALMEETVDLRAVQAQQAEAAAHADLRAAAQQLAELRQQVSQMREALDAMSKRDAAREVALASSKAAQEASECRAVEAEAALAATSSEVETLTNQVRALILKQKGVSESALSKRR